MDLLSAMAAFVEIADSGSLTAAAQRLGKAQPTMVRTLANLESHLGVRLLRRTTRRLDLTDEGREYLQRARQILDDVADAETALTLADPEPRGELRITAPVTFGTRHVMPAVNAFLSRWPEVKADVLLLDRPVNLLEEHIDLAVRIGALNDSSMIALPVGSMRQVLVASPEFVDTHRHPQHPNEITELPCVHFSSGLFATTWRFSQAGRNILVTTTPRVSVNQALPAVSACCSGLGIGRFLEYQVRDAVAAGDLMYLLESFEPEPLPINLLCTESRLMTPRLRLFREALRAELL